MKEYVFYTFDGRTESPTGKDVENCQILGFEKGISLEKARESLIKNNKWIEEKGFDIAAIESKQLLGDELKQAIEQLVDYYWVCQQKQYEKPTADNHIYLVLNKIKDIID